MRFKDLKLGQEFEIYNDDNEEATTSRGKIVEVYRTGTVGRMILAVQFDDELGTYMWGDLEEGTTARGLTLLEVTK
jgi:hypothetical protein